MGWSSKWVPAFSLESWTLQPVAHWQASAAGGSQCPGPTSRRHVKRWFGATGVDELSSLPASLRPHRGSRSTPTSLTSSGRQADRCRSASRSRRRADQAHQSVAGRADQRAHPMAPGRGRSRGQESQPDRPRQKIQPAALWAQTPLSMIVKSTGFGVPVAMPCNPPT